MVLISRNVFGLVKPGLSSTPTNLPPPILSTVKIPGVTTILDCRQVLLEISGPKTVQPPAKPIAVVMREGEREGEIEVLTINERRGTATIRNQGIIQTLTMGELLD